MSTAHEESRDLELWKHFAQTGAADKNTMTTVVAWLLLLAVGAMAFIAKEKAQASWVAREWVRLHQKGAARFANSLGRPCMPDREIAPIFWIYAVVGAVIGVLNVCVGIWAVCHS